ncbi:hypothetical protein QCN29_33265 [Streptomyces sp. HNM0663]|uniref:Uncharacterized protein n=1 Tax=Streptomyces chengmaiensis TaxID=3040919 RepID=A0ABT6HXY0_9ACTN|nr:hypothetical protein [Streptomyces chengmaiensis]MDH2393552.1 hypothetical protein [Streptomyces chengmaiensis]
MHDHHLVAKIELMRTLQNPRHTTPVPHRRRQMLDLVRKILLPEIRQIRAQLAAIDMRNPRRHLLKNGRAAHMRHQETVDTREEHVQQGRDMTLSLHLMRKHLLRVPILLRRHPTHKATGQLCRIVHLDIVHLRTEVRMAPDLKIQQIMITTMARRLHNQLLQFLLDPRKILVIIRLLTRTQRPGHQMLPTLQLCIELPYQVRKILPIPPQPGSRLPVPHILHATPKRRLIKVQTLPTQRQLRVLRIPIPIELGLRISGLTNRPRPELHRLLQRPHMLLRSNHLLAKHAVLMSEIVLLPLQQFTLSGTQQIHSGTFLFSKPLVPQTPLFHRLLHINLKARLRVADLLPQTRLMLGNTIVYISPKLLPITSEPLREVRTIHLQGATRKATVTQTKLTSQLGREFPGSILPTPRQLLRHTYPRNLISITRRLNVLTRPEHHRR